MIEWLLTASPAPGDTNLPALENAAGWKHWYSEQGPGVSRIELAVQGGFLSANVASAFYSGYQMAIRELLDRDIAGGLAFCVSEEQGNHPKNITTSLQEDGSISGEKKYVAGASEADLLVIIARQAGERMLRAVLVEAHQDGIELKKLESLHILPEVPHGMATFQAAKVLEVLPGDGHQVYSKKFRTVEDIFVSASLTGFLFRIARQYDWPRAAMQKMLLMVEMLDGLSARDPFSPGLHLLLGAFNVEMSVLLKEIEPCWASVPGELRKAWERDSAIVKVAAKAKQARLEKAWQDIEKITGETK